MAISTYTLINVVALKLGVVDDGLVRAEDVKAQTVGVAIMAGEHVGE